MLISHAHEPTGGRIPLSLLDTYVRYKQDTRAIITWLTSHGTRRYKNLKVVSIRDLMSLASIVQEKALVMPAAVDFHFREAIAARTQLTKFFRQRSNLGVNDLETVNHEFFTESLSQIYSGLCECCAKPEEYCKKKPENYCSDEKLPSLTNQYTTLQCEHDDNDNTYGDSPTDRHCPRHADSTITGASKVKPTPQIVDDGLSDAFEIKKELQEIEDLLSTINSVWEEAATGRIPILVASFMTNVAFAMFEGIESRLKVLCNGSNPETLRLKVFQVGTGTGDSPDSSHGSLVDNLQSTWHILSEFINRNKGGISTYISPRSSRITVRRGPGSASIDSDCYTTLLENIGRYMRAQRPPLIVLNGSPVYADIGYLLTHQENDTNGLRSAYGLQVLLEAYKSYLLTSDCRHAPSSCRLQALKFAQEIAKSIRTVLDDKSMPCRCPQTLAFHLENLQLDLQAFMREKLFDLYFQNPWVSGSHTLEMLEMSFYYGLRLFSYRHIVGAVLHVYNILRKLMGFQEIPLLERLCDSFNDIMFPGGRPDQNFRVCCMRYMGGRLRFSGHTADHKSGCHKFEIPVHSAKATAGFGLRKEANDSRFQYKKISLFHHVKEKDYHLDECLWDRVYQLNKEEDHVADKGRKRSSCYHRHPSHYSPFSGSSQQHLCELQRSVLGEFNGPFPIAKINFFEIYMACVHIVSTISDKVHGDTDIGERCLCFLEVIVTAADRYKDNEYKLQPFGYKGLVEDCKETMTTVLGDRSLEDFLWKGI